MAKTARNFLAFILLSVAAPISGFATSQAIAFDAIPNQIFGGSPFVIAAQASSGLPVTLTATLPAVCTMAGDLVILKSIGTCSITASQGGNGSFSAALPVTRTFTVRQAKPGGSFTEVANSPFTAGASPRSLAAGDFNGDGIADLVAGNQFSNNLTVLLGDGRGGFTQATGSPFAAGTNPLAVAVGDFNGDNIQDLAVIDNSSNLVVLLGNGSGGFTPSASGSFTVGPIPFAVVVGDFNGDGMQDIATANYTGSNVSVLLGNGLGGFAAATGSPFRVGSFPASLAVGDFNGDGIQDIAAANQTGNGVTVLRGNGAGGFAAVIGSPFAVGQLPLSVATGDFNGDGIPDLATANYKGGNVTVLLGIAAGNVPQTITFGSLGNVAYGVAPFPVSATSDSGLSVSFGSLTASICTVTGSIVTTVSAGPCPITASQAGNTTFAPAVPVTQTFTIQSASQTITFGPLSNQVFGTSPPSLSASATSGLPVAFTSDSPTVCTVSGVNTTFLSAGTCSITAFLPGSSSLYTAATPVTQSFIVLGYQLTTSVSPANSGGVMLSPASAGNYYAPGWTVCLTAAPAAGQIFTGWTGAVLNAADCLVMNANTSVTASFEANPVTASSALRFAPVAPCRVVDTRNSGPSISSGSTRNFTIAGNCGIPSTALAYSLNLTIVPQGTLGYVTMWPAGQAQPGVSTLNSIDGRVKSNAAIVPAGSGGAVSVYATDSTDVILDINGSFDSYTDPSALKFFPLTPCRVVDTRNATGTLGGPSLLASQSRSFPIVSSACGIPGNALAYSLNFTAIPQGPLGYLAVWPSGQSRPLVSTLNAPTGAVTANAAIVPAGTGGAIELFATNDTDMAIDINGYFAPSDGEGLSLYALAPCRIEDTRLPAGTPAFTGTVAETATGVNCGVPPEAQSLVLNATVVPPGELDFLSLWANGGSQPVVSTLNATDGSITSNMAIVPTTNGLVDAFAAGTTYLILDVSGYFAP